MQAGIFDLVGYKAGHKIAALQGNPFDFAVKCILFFKLFGFDFFKFVVNQRAGSFKSIQALITRRLAV